MSKYDLAIFTWFYNRKLQGIISTCIDDFYWSGFEFFRMSVIEKIEVSLVVKSENSRYCITV